MEYVHCVQPLLQPTKPPPEPHQSRFDVLLDAEVAVKNKLFSDTVVLERYVIHEIVTCCDGILLRGDQLRLGVAGHIFDHLSHIKAEMHERADIDFEVLLNAGRRQARRERPTGLSVMGTVAHPLLLNWACLAQEGSRRAITRRRRNACLLSSPPDGT